MGRRTVLLIVAALIAALGTGMVFLYVQRRRQPRRGEPGSRSRCSRPSRRSTRARRMAAAQAAGKIQLGTVPRAQVLAGAVNTAERAGERGRAVARSTPTSRSSPASSAPPATRSTLTIPDGDIAISVNLSDTGRVAGFVSPGANVAIFVDQPRDDQGRPDAHPAAAAQGPGDRGRRHDRRLHHHDRPGRRPDHRAAAQDAVHPRGQPGPTPRRSSTPPATAS